MTGQSVSDLERSERAGRVRVDTLDRAARAMDCTLVYAFLPVATLEQAVQSQAVAAAQQHAARVRHTMALEEQTPQGPPDQLVRLMADERVRTGRVWRSV